jgi:ADP-heptose:LPS heptosyltransferase
LQLNRRQQVRIAVALVASANAILRTMRKCLWPGPRPAAPARVCIYRIGNIGDIACAIPALDVIRRSLPRAHITMVSSPGVRGAPGARELLEGTGLVDEIVAYHTEDIASLKGRFQFIRAMRARRFDLWIELPIVAAYFRTLVRNLLAAGAARPGHALGWRYSALRLFKQAQSEQLSFHDESDRLLLLLKEEGFAVGDAQFRLALSSDECDAVTRPLVDKGATRRPIAALAPCAKAAPNRWPLARFAEVGRELAARGFTVAILGGQPDDAVCASVAAAIGADAINLAGRTTLRESCALLGRVALLVCNDSGVQHLAAAVGTPCVSLFSCRDFRGKWWPHGAQHIVLRKEVDCHTCLLDDCPRGNLCINLIEPREVIAAVDSILARAGLPVALERAAAGNV